MSKLFWEAIPGLQVNEEQRALFERVEIDKVVSTRDRSALKIYITSERLIHKRSIHQMEAEIKKQLFSGVPTTVTIHESYHLSAQYTPENLMKAYEDSILYELKSYSLMLFNLMRKAEKAFSGDHLCTLHLEDSLVARSKAGELKRVLEKVFRERCGVDLDVNFEYKAMAGKKDNGAEERRQAAEILQRAGKVMGEDGMLVADASAADGKADDGAHASVSGGAAQSGSGKSAAGGSGSKADSGAGSGQAAKTSGSQTGQFSGKDKFGNRKNFQKKPKNDDVLFGYDFDDHATPVSEVTPEMGAIVINGVVIAVEPKDLRSGKTILMFDLSDYNDTITVKMFLKE